MQTNSHHRPLLQLSVGVSADAEEAVAALLEHTFGRPASVYLNEITGASTVSVFCDSAVEYSDAKRRVVVEGLRTLRESGLEIGSGKISTKTLRRENWAESWKRHFKPISFGDALLIKPSWSRRRARRGQAVVQLDPGLSFGTGQHATTSFCLTQLVACRERGGAVLDIGTGSGIVAIAAAKLGFAPVEAFDFDPEAVRIARENARQNDAFAKVKISHKDLTTLPLAGARAFDFVCANLISNLLVAERRRIANRSRRGGTLVLAGILKTEFGDVQRAYEKSGFKLIAAKTEKEWRSGAFRKLK